MSQEFGKINETERMVTYMKLKGKILSLIILPLIILCGAVCIISYIEVNSSMKKLVHDDLYAVALAVEDEVIASVGHEDNFFVDENGQLWNGDDNLSDEANMALFDQISTEAHIDVTVFYGDTRRVTTVRNASGQRVLGTQAGEKVINTVLKNKEQYFAENVDVEGEPYFAYYLPFYANRDESSEPVGMVFAGMKMSDVNGAISTVIMYIVVVGILITLVCAIVGYIIASRIIKRIRSSMAIVQEVADGNLNVAINEADTKVKDEVGDIARAVAALKTRLGDIVRKINSMCEEIKSAAISLDDNTESSSTHISQIDTAVNEIAQGASTQAEETQHTTENVIVMGDMIEKDNAEIENLNVNAAEMNQNGENAISALKELEEINNKTKSVIDVIYDQTHTTNESAVKIREAVNLITDIAEETNLLSLNASIEAARAGEQGRGFAVVAGQIQKLAEQSNESARKIEEIVVSLIADSDKSVEMMNGIRVIMEEQNEKVNRTSEMFNELKRGIDQSVTAVDVIADSTKEIDRMRVGVVDASQNLTSIAEENAASAEETSAAVSELTGIMETIAKDAANLKVLADNLYDEFRYFKI